MPHSASLLETVVEKPEIKDELPRAKLVARAVVCETVPQIESTTAVVVVREAIRDELPFWKLTAFVF